MVNLRYERPEGMCGVGKIALYPKLQVQILFARNYADLTTGTLPKFRLGAIFPEGGG